MVRTRKFPLIGNGGGYWSFAHIEDVATATVAAIERGREGEIYNVCDDEPAQVREWLPLLARSIARARRGASLRGSRGSWRARDGRDDDRGPRRVERQGEGRARLDARVADVARGLRGAECRRAYAPAVSRSRKRCTFR
jgi:nucleoside-diphosphate-sugar epimerase